MITFKMMATRLREIKADLGANAKIHFCPKTTQHLLNSRLITVVDKKAFITPLGEKFLAEQG